MTLDIALQNEALAKKPFGRSKTGRDGDHATPTAREEGAKDLLLALRRHARSLHNTDEVDQQKWSALVNTALNALDHTRTALNDAEAKLQQQKSRISRLEELATTDELTGLANRRGFMTYFQKELDKTNRGLNRGGLLIMIDLDSFKSINDTYGHNAGDEALKLVSRHLIRAIRTMDVAARLGGDEFVLLLSHADKQCAYERAQSLALKLNSLILHFQGHAIPVRASIGVKSYTLGDDMRAVLDSADRTMYRAKSQRQKSEQQKEQA